MSEGGSVLSNRLRAVLPFLVSAGLVAWLLGRIDLGETLEYVSLSSFMRFAPALALFSVVSLAIEAQCLHRVATAHTATERPLPRLVAARIKAACYVIGVLNHVLGAAALSLLLRRRTGATLAAAAGMVFLVMLLDVGSVLVSVGLGGLFLQTTAVSIRLGLVAALVVAILAGFAFLRAPVDLGPLERLRGLPILAAPRETPLPLLIEVGVLRLGLVGSFVALVAALFDVFAVPVSLEALAFGTGVMLAVSALPLALAGIGTGQVTFVAVFGGLAPDAQLLAMSVVLSGSMILGRSLLGLVFASEFTREGIQAARAAAATDGAEDG